MAAEPRARRTNAERAAETVDLIINATLDAIAEVGVRNATTGEISRREFLAVRFAHGVGFKLFDLGFVEFGFLEFFLAQAAHAGGGHHLAGAATGCG